MHTYLPGIGVLSALLVTTCVVLAAGPAGAAPGDLDPTFGDYGRVRLDTQPENPHRGILARQTDGRILVARSSPEASQILVLRLMADGQPDLTFGGTGLVQTDFGGGTSIATEIAVRADGRILIAGQAAAGAWEEGQAYHAALVALDPTGSVDASFGNGGRVSLAGLTHGGGSPTALIATSDDIMVGMHVAVDSPDVKTVITVVRLSGEGAIDNGYGDLGTVTLFSDTDLDSEYAELEDLAAQEDGKLILCGTRGRDANGFGVQVEAVAIRLLANGELDSSFGDRGVAEVGPGWATACAVQSDGRLVLAADFVTYELGRVIRVLPDGSLDPGFAAAGTFETTFGLNPARPFKNEYGSWPVFSRLDVLADGRIAVGGSDGEGATTVLVLGSDGTPDEAFGPEGMRKLDMGHGSELFLVALPSFSFGSDDLIAVGGTQDGVTVLRLHLDDRPGASVVGFRNSVWAREAEAAVAQVTVHRSGSAEGAVSVNYRTVDRVARSPDDYEASAGTLAWQDGDSAPRTISIAVVNDGKEEQDETFDLILESPLGAGLAGSIAQVYILDPPIELPPPAETSPQPASSGGGGAIGASLLALLLLLWCSSYLAGRSRMRLD